MEVTHEVLKERLGWSLNQKVDHSLYIIESALAHTNGNAYVSFSGGKDSVILLYLSRIIKPDIKAVFFNTTNEFPEIYQFLKEVDCLKINPEINLKTVLAKYGFPLVSKEQAQYIREARTTKSSKLLHLRLHGRKGNQGKISNKWQHLIYAPFNISEKCCHILKKYPAYKFEKQNKLLPIIGTSVNESRLRKQKYLSTGCNAFSVNRPASYPLSIWNEKDKWQFIRENNILYCSVYDKGETQTGCMICGFGCHRDDRFIRLKENHPKAFEIGMNYTNNNIPYHKAIQYSINSPYPILTRTKFPPI